MEKEKRPFISKLSFVVLFLALGFLFAKYVGPKGLVLREYIIRDEKIPTSFDEFTIVQFSDLEFFTTFSMDDLEDMVDKINSLKPSIVVFTGDLVKGSYEITTSEKDKLVNILKKIDPLLDKYSIRGDDDSELYDEIMLKSGFVNISNSYDLIYYKGLEPIILFGLDSLNSGRQDIARAFGNSLNSDSNYAPKYRILLAHEPDTVDLVKDYDISLMLSGHSHNSEINIPFLKCLYGIRGAKKYYDEHYLVNGTDLYISSGLGTSKLKMRLLSKPSISVFKLYSN